MRFFLLLSILFASLNSTAQQAFIAKADVQSVPAGSTFGLTFTLKNLDGKEFTPPDLAPFKILNGPMRSYQQTIVNGKSSKSSSFTFTLQATKEGSFEIPAAIISIGGKSIKSNRVRIKVTKAKDPKELAEVSSDATYFLRAEIDSSSVYIGQQVIVRYRIYTRVNIDNFNIISESPYEACFAQALDAYKEPVVTAEINGISYSTKVLRKVALFPQQSGRIEIQPMVLQVGIQRKNRRKGFGGFFSSAGFDRKNINSNSLQLNVKSPFKNAPMAFTGAVGDFQVKHSISKRKATTDDAIVLAVRLSGNGDVKTIRAPEMVVPQKVESYDPKTTLERMINATDSIRGEKTFEYLITFSEPGNFTLTPSFAYFNPNSNKFITQNDTLKILISQGKNVTPADNQLDLAQDGASLQDYKYGGTVRRTRQRLFQQPLYWASFGAPILAFLLLSWRKKNQERLPEIAIDHTKLAKDRLQVAASHLEKNEANSFYEELAFSLKKYLGWRLKVDPSEFSKQSIVESLQRAKISESLIDRTKSFMDHCDVALYGGGAASQKMKDTYDQAVELISGFEEQF